MSTRRWLILVVVVGAVLRVVPIWFGLPYLKARPDEDLATLISGQILTGDLNPRFFHWPSLTFYAFATVYGLASLIRRVLWLDPELSPADRLVLARGLVAVAGTTTIVILFWLARRVAGATTGLVAAALLAVAMLHVRDSHFALADVLMTLFVTTSLALLIRAGDEEDPRRSLRWFAGAGVAGGLAVSTKYNAAAIVAAMGTAQLLVWSRSWRSAVSPYSWLPTVLFTLLFVAGFLIATPYAVLDFGRFAADLRFNFTHLSEGHGLDLGRGWSFHLTRSLPYGVGPTAFAAAVPGAVLLFRHHRRHALVIGSFFAALYLTIGSGYTVFFRYILPLVPIVCLLGALTVRYGADWLSTRTKLPQHTSLALLVGLTAGPGLVNSVWFDVLLARADTRVIAGRWLEQRLQPGDTLHDSGDAYASLHLTRAADHQRSFDPTSGSFGDDGRRPDWLVLYDSPVFLYTRAPPALRDIARREYVLMKTVTATPWRSRSAVYDLQDAFFMPLWGFWTVERPGPNVRIYWRRGTVSRRLAAPGSAIPPITGERAEESRGGTRASAILRQQAD